MVTQSEQEIVQNLLEESAPNTFGIGTALTFDWHCGKKKSLHKA